MAGNVVALRQKRFRPADIIEQAILSGRKLPLEIMLQHLWRLEDEAERLESSQNIDDQLVARVHRDRLFRVAEAVAPYVHGKIAQTIISGDETNPVRHTVEQRRTFDRLAAMSDEQAQRLLDDVGAGKMTLDELHEEFVG
jgi:uncharacterized protein YjiS (DUF1127 family)